VSVPVDRVFGAWKKVSGWAEVMIVLRLKVYPRELDHEELLAI